MSTITQRIASAFAILFGHYGDVTRMARDREQSRQSLYREAEQVIDAVDGATAHAQITELQQQLAQLRSQVQALQEHLEQAVEITPDKQEEFATVAQAEGVSLSVARRLWRVIAGPRSTPRVPTLGRASREAGQRAGPLLAVLDEAARPRVEQVAADEILGAEADPDARRTREPLLAHGTDGPRTRRGHLGRRVRPVPGLEVGGP